MAKKGKAKGVMDKLWPKARKELDKVLKSTKELLDKGEKYVKAFSEKGAENAKKLSLVLKREKLYYNLGKLVAAIPKDKWSGNKKVTNMIKNIETLGKEVKKAK